MVSLTNSIICDTMVSLTNSIICDTMVSLTNSIKDRANRNILKKYSVLCLNSTQLTVKLYFDNVSLVNKISKLSSPRKEIKKLTTSMLWTISNIYIHIEQLQN